MSLLKKTHRSGPTRTSPWARIDLPTRPLAQSDAPTKAELHIYQAIGYDPWGEGISARQLAQQISELDVDAIDVYINSPGGDAWDGIAIMNALRRHRATVTVTVDALAASAASVIAMAGDHVVMNRGAELMIHEASGCVWGDAEEMRKTASVLDKLCESYADAYAARAGGDRDTWREAMRAETWYTAEEAVEAGLADEWVDAPSAEADFDRSAFRYQGRAQAPAPNHMLPASEPGDLSITHREEIAMSDNLREGLRQRLGMTGSDVDDSTILATLDQRLSADATADLPEGVTMIDATALEELRADAAAGRSALAAMDAARRDAMIEEAVAQGRIAPSARESWRAMADKDEEGTKTLLASMAVNTVPVEEIGTGKDRPTSADDELYAAAWGGLEMKEAH